MIHPDIPTVPNVGFLLDGEIFHPGDSYTVPEDPAGTLLLPGSGPWHSTAEMIDYARAVGPRRGFIIHEALLNETGLGVLEMFLGLAAGPNGPVHPAGARDDRGPVTGGGRSGRCCRPGRGLALLGPTRHANLLPWPPTR